MKTQQKEKTNLEKPTKADKPLTFLRFSGLAFEMLAFILIGIWLGSLVDDYYEPNRKVFTAAGALLGITGSLFSMFKKLPKN